MLTPLKRKCNITSMNKRISAIFLFITLLLYGLKVEAKAILLNEDVGLNNIEITAITKDKGGIMWIGTKRGLNKYDGYRFTEIGFFKNYVTQAIVYDSSRNVVWVGTDMGLFYVHCKTGDIFQCTILDKKNNVTCLAIFNDEVTVGFERKYIMQIKAGFECKVIYYFDRAHLRPKNMVIDHTGNIYLTIGKIVKLERQKGWNNKETKYVNKSVAYIEAVHNEVYAGGVNTGIWNVNSEMRAEWFLDSLNSIGQDPECMLECPTSILIAYRNHTRIFEIKEKERTITDMTIDDVAVMGNKRINCLFRDEFNITWVGTNKGLLKLVPDNPKPVFERLLWNQGVSTRQISVESNGDIYVGTYSGFYWYQKQNDHWFNTNRIYYMGKQQPFSQRSLLNSDSKFIYLGSDAIYFVRYDKKNQTFKKLIITSANGLCNTLGSTLALEKDTNGMIWLGSEKGLLRFDPVVSELQCHTKDKFSVDGFPIRCMYMLQGKTQFWVGTENGIYLIDIDKGTQKHFDMRTVPALSGNLINAITVDTKGAIWVATSDAGIDVLSSDCKEVYSINRGDGLSSNEVYDMLWQDSVRLWISTYNGLNYYHTESQKIIQYFTSDGITANEFNQNSACKAPDGKLYFGGINGITAFYPTLLEIKEQPFQVFASCITKFEKKSGVIVDVLVNDDNAIDIYPGDNLLTFSFAAKDYTHPELYTYFYKIEGQHSDWISLGAQTTLRLESLKDGTYKLLVKATKGSRGISSENVLVYQLTVHQEFYQTVWFYILLLMVLAGLIWFYFFNRLRTQKKLERLRVKIASNLHDEVGSLLTRITMSADRLVARMPHESETRDKLEGVSILSREANVAMSDVLWTIDSRNDFTGSLTDRMREHAEDLLLPRGVDVSIDFAEIDHNRKLSPEFRQHLFLLYKEIINNIIKHSRANSVHIIYKQSKEHCVLQVKNDGVAQQEGAVSTGQGLRNIKMRAELLKGKATIHKENEYFEVIVTI